MRPPKNSTEVLLLQVEEEELAVRCPFFLLRASLYSLLEALSY
jgi:hypothetical protein